MAEIQYDADLRQGAIVLNAGYYAPVAPPVADSDELAAQGPRIILYFAERADAIRVSIAPKDVIYAGWVIGLVKG